MRSRGPAAIKSPLIALLNDANMLEETITNYTEVLNHLLACYTTDAVIARVFEKISNVGWNIRGPKVRGKTRRATAVQDDSILFLSEKNGPSLQMSWTKVLNQVS